MFLADKTRKLRWKLLQLQSVGPVARWLPHRHWLGFRHRGVGRLKQRFHRDLPDIFENIHIEQSAVPVHVIDLWNQYFLTVEFRMSLTYCVINLQFQFFI